MMLKRSLINMLGPTSVYVDVEITDEGDVLFSVQDIGEAPKKVFKTSEYEYWYTIPAKNKDAFFIALIEKVFRGKKGIDKELRELLDSNGIAFELLAQGPANRIQMTS